MAVQITQTTQLSVFSLIRATILADSTLSNKFTNANIFQFEPNHKSGSFRGFPYIWINIPFTEVSKVVFDNSVTLKPMTVDVSLRMDYFARDNFLSFANNLIRAIEAYESTFEASGYYDVMIDLIDVDSNQVINQKELVEGLFEVRFNTQVAR